MSHHGVSHFLQQAETPTAIIETLLKLVRVFEANDVEHLVVGGVAAALCGQLIAPKVCSSSPNTSLTACAKSGKDIDVMVHDIQKAHRALCANWFHVSGRKGRRKAWTRMPDYGTVKVDLHEDPIQVASVDVRETVERVNVALEAKQLALTLKGLAQPEFDEFQVDSEHIVMTSDMIDGRSCVDC